MLKHVVEIDRKVFTPLWRLGPIGRSIGYPFAWVWITVRSSEQGSWSLRSRGNFASGSVASFPQSLSSTISQRQTRRNQEGGREGGQETAMITRHGSAVTARLG